MQKTNPNDYIIDYTKESVRLQDFLLGEVIPFFIYDILRSIPHAIDGLKPSQRKILWVIWSKYASKTVPDIKVAQLAGEVAKLTYYKHGEDSLCDTIINMAIDYPTSKNNINLLVPEGQFGIRHCTKPASARYIYTCGEPILKALFPKADEPILTHLECEGHRIEPEFMIPVIAFLLCTGAEGLGTGWSSNIPCYNPSDLIAWCRRYIQVHRNSTNTVNTVVDGITTADTVDSATPETTVDDAATANSEAGAVQSHLKPWMEGITGNIRQDSATKYTFEGTISKLDSNTVHITELPICTGDFMFEREKLAKCDTEWLSNHPFQPIPGSTGSDSTVDLKLIFDTPLDQNPGVIEYLQKRTELSMSLTNMTAWAPGEQTPHKFKSPEEICILHAQKRLEMNEKRRQFQIQEQQSLIVKYNDMYRFVCAIMNNPNLVFKRKKADVAVDLAADNYALWNNSYDYLLDLPFSSATEEYLEKLRNNTERAILCLQSLETTTPYDIWEADLLELEKAYADALEMREYRRATPFNENNDNDENGKAPTKRRKRTAKPSTKTATKKTAKKVTTKDSTAIATKKSKTKTKPVKS